MTSIRATVLGFGSSSEAPVASFITDVSSFSLGGVIRFTNTSVSLISDLWMVQGGLYTFVEGTNENSLNPVIRFWEDVTYTVSLRAWNAYGTDLTSDTYSKASPIPVASFTISDATPNVGQIVTFTDTSTESPTSWSWAISPSTYVFEGGTSATSQNPQIAFLDESENYTVNLTATNASGSDSTAFSNNITSNALESVHFEFDPYLYGDADNQGVTAPTTYQTPTYNSAGYYDFDGGNGTDGFEYDTPNGINDTDGSIEIWCQPDQVTGAGYPLTANQDTTDDFRFEMGQYHVDPYDFVFYIKGANGAVYGRIIVPDVFAVGEWAHIVVTRKAGVPLYSTAAAAFEVYVNGSLATTGVAYAGSGYWLEYIDGRTPWNFTVGGYVLNNNGVVNGGFNGKIGRAAIYQTPLTATRISENYNWLSQRSYDFGLAHFEYDPYLHGDADNKGMQVPTTYGSPTYNSAGYYTFDGTDDAFYYDYDGGINDAVGAIEVFIDWDNTQNGIAISWARDNSSSYRGHILFSQTDNVIRVFIREAASTNQIRLDWDFAGTSGKYHIVLNKTADGGSSPSYNYEMYINGVSQGNADSDASTATQGLWFDDLDGFNPYNITVGGLFANSVTLPNNEIIGDIYRAAIYTDALSGAKITENYNKLLER